MANKEGSIAEKINWADKNKKKEQKKKKKKSSLKYRPSPSMGIGEME